MFALLVSAPFIATADMELSTPDGRRVLLKDDQTWEYVDTDQPAVVDTVPLSLVNRKDVFKGCRFGVRLVNTLPYDIKDLVPQFSAIIEGGVSYQTVFKSFHDMKPTTAQYKEIEFRGIKCASILELKVSGGDRCTMGELTRYTPVKGVCLEHIRVVESDILPFTK